MVYHVHEYCCLTIHLLKCTCSSVTRTIHKTTMSILDDVDILAAYGKWKYAPMYFMYILTHISKQQLEHELRWQMDIHIKYS